MLAIGTPDPDSQRHVRLLLILTAIFYALTLATRLHTMTHMMHQLLGSVVLGAVSIPILFACAAYAFPTGVSRTANVLMTGGVAAGVICYVAYKTEQDDFPLLHLSQDETDRVVREIVDFQLRAPPQVYRDEEDDLVELEPIAPTASNRSSQRRPSRRSQQRRYDDDFET